MSLCALLIPLTFAAAFAGEVNGEVEPERPPKPVFLALPLVSYDSNLRLGLGAFGQVILPDPSGETPYRANLSTQLLFTTGGYQNHFLRADLPALGGSRWRLMVTARRVAWTRAPYYGLGPESARSEEAEHDLWEQSRWLLRADARAGLPGPFEVFGALNVQREGVSADPEARLSQEQPLGFEGGRLVWLGVGVIYEGRDDEINPHKGLAADLSVSGVVAVDRLGLGLSRREPGAARRGAPGRPGGLGVKPHRRRAVWRGAVLHDEHLRRAQPGRRVGRSLDPAWPA
ncbi:MAG: hypothetical protein IPO67_14120 [Deltaproteobacteria bacterium]|nr:hypothetical protein [Deltaproteobacteria bacterium]